MNKLQKFTIGVVMVLAISGASIALAQTTSDDPVTDSVLCPRFHRGTIAEALGMTVEELAAAVREGKTIRELAEEAGVELPTCPNPRSERAEYLEAVAEALGMTVDELRAAISPQNTLQALAEEAGIELPPAPRLQRAAEVLGITVEELQAALDEGKTIRELAEELGVDLPGRGMRDGGFGMGRGGPGFNRPGAGGFGPGRGGSGFGGPRSPMNPVDPSDAPTEEEA